MDASHVERLIGPHGHVAMQSPTVQYFIIIGSLLLSVLIFWAVAEWFAMIDRELSGKPGPAAFEWYEWFAWYPRRDEDGNYVWLRYVQRYPDGKLVRFPADVD